MTPQINYSPLADMEKISVDGQSFDLTHPGRAYTLLHVKDQILIAFIILVGIITTFVAGPVGLILIIGVPVYIYGRRLRNQETKVWTEFAAVNGWSIQPASLAIDDVPPTVAAAGHSPKSSDVISGSLNQVAFSVFKHEYTIGSGKSAHTYKLTIIILKINASLPHMLLRASKALTVGNPDQLKEKLKLEGDFNKYFKVFAQPNMEVDDLTILTPDVMEFLISSDPSYNIETSGNNLYIIADNDLRRVDKMPALFDFAQKFYAQVLQNLPLAQQSIAAASSQPAAGQAN